MQTKTGSIFKSGSNTYFYSSLFFPKSVRQDVEALYVFVRTADDFVDSIPQQKQQFHDLRNEYQRAQKNGGSKNGIIQKFVMLVHRKSFDTQWVEAFLDAMEMDLSKRTYSSMDEIEKYMYGSAEVIGLCMAKIMNLPEKSYNAARTLGKAMQWINFIRDIHEDNKLGRIYLPLQELHTAGLQSLEKEHVLANRKAFDAFMRKQIERYETWQLQAEKGYQYIPRQYLIPIRTAAEMYRYTAEVIQKNPHVVFQKKVKPYKLRILATGIRHIFS